MDDKPLVIIPCGQAKVWDDDPQRGPTPARDAYTGAPFKVNRSYADRHGGRWVILSAKYGFVTPDSLLPGPYNVTFKKRSTNPVEVATLTMQIRELGLHNCERVVALGGKEYRAAVGAAFVPFDTVVEFPFAGLPIGLAMQAIKRATSGFPPAIKSRIVSEPATTSKECDAVSMIQSRDSVLKAIKEFDTLGRKLFLKRHGFGVARRYFLIHNGKKYDSKAIVGAAYGFENPSKEPLHWNDFNGGWSTVKEWLEDLGFEIHVLEEPLTEE